jgi:hypothetical protein
VGALFQPFIKLLIEGTCDVLQKEAIQFVCNWLPVINEDALLFGIDKLLRGLEESRAINCSNFTESTYLSEKKVLLEVNNTNIREVTMKNVEFRCVTN